MTTGSRAETIEEMSELAEALFDIIEEENADVPDIRHAVVEALAHQNLYNIEMAAALSALSEGRRPEAELDSLVLNMKAVHKSLVKAISAWNEAE
ncbi:hypothetical protein [Martelella mangrovi]|uniref:Uncharacterized protein n=1 Tax=Martelella mangrovi TaxID=1397477 RepID=A0ABV2I5H1_9HYPH|nr:hypothetical protein [uncultured Martelella sp.]